MKYINITVDKYIIMDLSTLSKEQKYALDLFKRGENVFLSGPGGTGKTNRSRLTSVQAKGNASGSIIFKSGGASGDTIATFLFGTEGLDMYFPGNGILFEDGIHATISGTTGVTITFT